MANLDEAIRKIDAANSLDPNKEVEGGKELSKEFLYGQRMTQWLDTLNPGASPELKIAVRAQHICRWEIPRSSYPEGRAGYLKWRRDLGRFHGQKAGEIASGCGFTEEQINRIRSLLSKQKLKTDPEAQILEDCACLVFLQYYFFGFVLKHKEEKAIGIVQKTWEKMSGQAREYALKIPMSEQNFTLVKKALGQ